MGWLAFAGLAAIAGLLLWRLGFAKPLWMFGAAAVMLAAAGYVWQGRPGLAAAPADKTARAPVPDGERIALRDAMLGRFGSDSAYATTADAMLRAGSPDAAVRVLLGGIDSHRDSLMLWTELGSVLAMRDGTLSPAARLAFNRAASLNPRHPGPPFFKGQAQVLSGQFREARASWARALAVSPAAASYRRDIAVRLVLLDRLIAAQQRPD